MEYARTYAAPATNVGELSASGIPGTLSKALHGVTTFVFKCRDMNCGELKKIEALGKESVL